MREAKIWIVIILLSVLFAFLQMVFLARNESITSDEKAHIPAGFSYYQFRSFSLNPEHPPLGKLIVALPVFLSRPNFPEESFVLGACSKYYYNCWRETLKWGTDFLYHSGNNLLKIVFEARLVNIVLTLILILFLTYWGYRIGLWPVAVLAAFLGSFQPLFLAHGHLANTDIGITTFSAFFFFCWWKYLKQGVFKWFFLSAFFFFLAAITKFTFVLLIPFVVVSTYISVFKHKENLLKASFKVILFGFIVWFLIMAVYGFAFKLSPEFNAVSSDQTIRLMREFHWISVPALFFKGLFMVVGHASSGHESYLGGDFAQTGWWYFFPTAFFLKTPVGFLILFIFSLFSLKRFAKKDIVLQAVLLGGSFSYLVPAMFSRADLGLRQLMPVFPLLIIFTSQLASVLKEKNHRILIFLMSVFIVFSVALNFKNQAAYFNEFAGGSPNGFRFLLYSDYDWGQSFYSIKNYIDEKKLRDVYVGYRWEVEGEWDYYLKGVRRLEDIDFTKRAVIIVDPVQYMLSQNAWLKKLKVIDRMDNTLFVLEYIPE